MMKKNIKKRISILSMMCISLNTLLFNPIVNASYQYTINNKKDLQSIRDYNVYYGWEYTPEIIEEMKLYDLLILEPLELGTDDRKQIKQDIQDSGTLIYGYMCATEISQWDDEVKDLVTPDEYLYIDGEPYIFWGNNVGDLRVESYRRKIIDIIGTRIVNEGYDGLFLDTLDNYEYTDTIKYQELVDELVLASVQFVKELKIAYPDLKIIQNRGFLALYAGTKDYVDGFMYEDFKTVEGDWYGRMKDIVDRYMSLGNKVVLAMINSEDNKDILYAQCMEYGWKFFCRPDEDYATWYKYLNPTLVMDKKNITANTDIYIKSKNSLFMSLNTNSITFENFSGVDDMEKQNAVEISISSSLPYQLNAYLVSEIQNADKTNTIDKSILNIKESSEVDYQAFSNTIDKIILKDNCVSGNSSIHNIDLKLAGNIAHKKDIYKTVIKFEVEQK